VAIEDNGFEIKRYNTIQKEMNEEFSTNAEKTIDTSSDSIAGIMNSIPSRQLALLWELGESINDSTDITKAEGSALDNLALQVGLIREPDKQSYGVAWFTGKDGTTISTSAVVTTARGDEFTPTSEVVITPTSCLKCTLKLNTFLPSTEYQVVVEGTQYSYTGVIGETEQDIVDELALELANGSSVFTTTVEGTSIILEIEEEARDAGNTMEVFATTYISFSEITSIGIVESTEYGFIEGAAHSLNLISTTVNGWDSVDNPSDMTLGRFQQNDDELRTSILNNYNIKDSVTHQGVKDAVSAVAGVTSASVYDNENFYNVNFNSVDVAGKSYMVTVDGGVDEDIAKVIWDTKPLGIKTSGSEEHSLIDDDGQEQKVWFSRSSKQFFYMKISITKYLEEEYPLGGDNRVKEACLLFGDALSIGEDVIPQRFEGNVFENVSGIDVLSIEVAYSSNSSLTVNDTSLEPLYTSSRVAMDATQSPLFATNRMEVTIV